MNKLNVPFFITFFFSFVGSSFSTVATEFESLNSKDGELYGRTAYLTDGYAILVLHKSGLVN